MIKNILFDMGGVIFRQDTEEAFARFRHAGLDPDKYMGAFGQKDFFLDVESGAINTDEFCRRMAEAVGRKEISFEEAQHCWLGFLTDVPVERLHDLERLKSKYHLGLLSNTNPFIMDYTNSTRFSADGLPIRHYFHTLFLSYEMGVCKPAAEIFQQALAADGMRPEDTVFVDDSEKNVRAAEAVGIKGLHVKTNEEWMPRLQSLLQAEN